MEYKSSYEQSCEINYADMILMKINRVIILRSLNVICNLRLKCFSRRISIKIVILRTQNVKQVSLKDALIDDIC